MIKQVWKFEIFPLQTSIAIPKYAEILTVQTQNDKAYIWTLVNPENEKELRQFEVYGTGHDIRCDLALDRKYINTFQMQGGELVFHLFEVFHKQDNNDYPPSGWDCTIKSNRI